MSGMTTRLKEIMKRAETWPEADQDEAVELLLALEEERANAPPLTEEDREALERSAEDVRQGRFASDDAVREVLDRYRRR
jgi:hypothetical protein